MIKDWKKIAILTAGVVTGCAIAYGGIYIALRAQFSSTLSAQGFKTVRMTGFKPFLDGLVIEELQLDQFRFEKVYLSGSPFQQLQRKPNYIYIKHLQIDPEKIFSGPVRWPFHPDWPLTIPQVDFQLDILGKTIPFSGEIKQEKGLPLLYDFSSMDKSIKLNAQTEIRLRNHQLTSVDLEFQNARLNLVQMKTKRSSGWLSFTYDQKWDVIGEVESGFTDLAGQSFLDTTLKLNGTVDHVDFTFTGKEDVSKAPWVFDHQNDKLYIRHDNTTKAMRWQGMNQAMLTSMAGVIQTYQPEPEKKVEEKPKEKPKKIEKPKPEPVIEEQPEIVPVEPTLVVEPVSLPEVSFAKLVNQSLFKGFSYDQPLVYVSQECQDDAGQSCWVAHGTNGVLTYDAINLPGYFLRQANYEESQQFRRVLQGFRVQSITLKGRGETVQIMELKGETAQGQPIYLELSVEGLE